MTVFVFITYDNLQNIQAERNLPLGVTEVELTNWTKTREPEEIGDGEKKMNSHSDRVELNEGISAEDVESIDGLYKSGNGYLNLTNINYVTSSSDKLDNVDENVEQSTQKVTGNKVLRAFLNSGSSIQLINYNIGDLHGYLKSDKPINWNDEGKVTWNLHTCVDPKNKVNSVELRMISASFNITSEQIRLLQNGNAYAVLGVPAENEYGFEPIMPYNDMVSVFLNGIATSINYECRPVTQSCKLNKFTINYKTTKSNYCWDKTYHQNLSSHTDGHHIHMDTLSGGNKGELTPLDLRNWLRKDKNNIDILIGNYITNSNQKNISCGFSKINLYIIEKPKIDVTMKLYKYKNGQVVYFDENYRPTKGDEVYVRIDIKNTSDNYTLKNTNFSRTGRSNQDNITVQMSPDNFIYNGNNITDDIRCYINEDFKNKYKIDALKSLQPKGVLTIMSDKMKYTVGDTNIKYKQIRLSGNISVNYIRDEFKFISAEKIITASISDEGGILEIKCSVENDDGLSEESFLINVESDKDFSNLSIKPGETYMLKNLSINDSYYINLVVPQDYEIVDSETYQGSSQNKINLSQMEAQNYTGKIEIQLKKKNNPYFYKNKQGKININVLDKSKDL